MKPRAFAGRLLPLVVFALLGRTLFAAGTTTTESKAQRLELQIAALSKLQDLEITSDQLKALREMAKDTAAKDVKYNGKNVPGYPGALQALRDAFLAGDDDKISDTQDAVDDLRDNNDIDYDIDIPLTDAARQKAPAAVKLLTSSQVANYLSEHSDDVPDATETILDALDECQDGQTDFDALKLEASEQVGRLVAGLDTDAGQAVGQKVSDLLDRAHAMSPDDLQAKRDELDDEAKQIGDAADAFEQLRHWMEGEMADLLSNPQFGPIAGARIKAMDKAATQPDATEQ